MQIFQDTEIFNFYPNSWKTEIQKSGFTLIGQAMKKAAALLIFSVCGTC